MKSLGFFKEVAQSIKELTGWEVPDKYVAIAFLSSCALAIFILLYKYFIKPAIKNHKWRKDQLNIILKNHKSYMSRKERWLYIDTYFQTEPPHDYDEPSDSEYKDLRTKNDSIYHFLNKAFKKDNDNPPFYCILGGSGMGKTTFAVNLVRKYINKYKEKTLPYPIKLLYCGANKEDGGFLVDDIVRIENKENTLLILDALDENNEAINNFSNFFPKLLNAFKDFRIVVITCRTQFFESKNDEPSLLPFRDEKTKQLKQFKKYYVSPLNKEEVNHYLNKKYFLRFLKRKRAGKIVSNCKNLMARPLLLSYMDDLVNSDIKDLSISSIYQIIIDKWLEREAKFATVDNIELYKQKLLDFSKEIAIYMAQNDYTKYNKEGFGQIIKKHALFISEKNLKGRSLLNRDSSDIYKFAHKSFMEYLVAKSIFENEDHILDSLDYTSNDMIPAFWIDLVKNLLLDTKLDNWSINLFASSNESLIIRPVTYLPYIRQMFDIGKKVHSLTIKDVPWTKRNRFMLSLISDIEYNSVEMYYDDKKDVHVFGKIFPLLPVNIQSILIFNYNFYDAGFIEYFSLYLRTTESLKYILFYSDELDLKRGKASDFLRSLQFGRKAKSSVKVLILCKTRIEEFKIDKTK